MKYGRNAGEVVKAVAADRAGMGYVNAADLPGGAADLTKAGIKVLAIGEQDHAAMPGTPRGYTRCRSGGICCSIRRRTRRPSGLLIFSPPAGRPTIFSGTTVSPTRRFRRSHDLTYTSLD